MQKRVEEKKRNPATGGNGKNEKKNLEEKLIFVVCRMCDQPTKVETY